MDRQHRASEVIPAAHLTIGLTVQPDVIQSLADKRELRGRGLLARFAYSLPASRVGYRDTDAPPVSDAVRDRYHRKLRALLDLPYDARDAEVPAVHVLRLEGPARERFARFERWVERELRPIGALGAGELVEWGSKLAGLVARLTAVLHMAEHADEATPWTIPVAEASVGGAIAIGEYLIPHARAAFAEMGRDPVVQEAKDLLRWVERQVAQAGAREFTRREIQQANRGHFRRAEAIDRPLALLAEYGYVRLRPVSQAHRPGRPPSSVYEINPLWAAQNACNRSSACGRSRAANSGGRERRGGANVDTRPGWRDAGISRAA